MKFSQEQLDDSILDKNIVMNKTKEEIIINEYEKSQKNIQYTWLGEGWYKTTPNSFNYFAAGFEAGMIYARENNGPPKNPIKIYESKNLYIEEDSDGNISIIDKTSLDKAIL